MVDCFFKLWIINVLIPATNKLIPEQWLKGIFRGCEENINCKDYYFFFFLDYYFLKNLPNWPGAWAFTQTR